jgi:hypothetical protein
MHRTTMRMNRTNLCYLGEEWLAEIGSDLSVYRQSCLIDTACHFRLDSGITSTTKASPIETLQNLPRIVFQACDLPLAKCLDLFRENPKPENNKIDAVVQRKTLTPNVLLRSPSDCLISIVGVVRSLMQNGHHTYPLFTLLKRLSTIQVLIPSRTSQVERMSLRSPISEGSENLYSIWRSMLDNTYSQGCSRYS